MIKLTIIDKEFQKSVDKFIKKSGKGFQDAVNDATLRTHKVAVNKAPIKSGGGTGLRNNIKFTIENKGFTGEVISHASYSEAVEDGTKPHVIRVKKKRVLAGAYRHRPSGWQVSASSKKMGYATYGKEVRHPGTKPQPFMKPAFDIGRRVLMKRISDVFK